MSVVVLFLIGVYILLSAGFVKLVEKLTNKKRLYKYLAIALCILLPTWDIVLGMIVYFPACLFVPKVAIYETAETEGIYYEGMHDYMYELDTNGPVSERTRVGTISDVFREGYTYAESKVGRKGTERYFEYRPIPPVYYRCTPLPKNPYAPAYEGTNCIAIDQPMSRYMVKVTTKTIVRGVETNVKRVIDKSTGTLMAEYHRVVFNHTLPFFNWLYPVDNYAKGAQSNCPTKPSYYDFEYEVLKPIK